MTELSVNLKNINVQSLADSSSKSLKIDSFLMFLLAVSPLLQHYKGIGVNPSLAILSMLAIIAIVRLSLGRVKISTGFLLLMCYGLFASFIHGISLMSLMREIVQLVLFLAILNGLFDIVELRRACRIIATLATVLIIIQYFCFYVLGFHLQLVAIPLLSESNSQWFSLVRTGTIGVTGKALAFYRPSAFFLEPSHFAIYCIPVIVMTLFSSTGDRKKERLFAYFISFGVLLSTSGMGIAVVIMCWMVYLIFFLGKNGETRTIKLRGLLSRRSVMIITIALIILLLLYMLVPFFRHSVNRIFITSGGETVSAIEGRTATGLRSLKMLSGIRSIIGFGDIYDITNWNMATFFFVTFKFGYLGAVLYYSFYIYSLFKLNREAYIMVGIFLILSLFTVHMFGAYYKMYYTAIILYGYVQRDKEGIGTVARGTKLPNRYGLRGNFND